MAAIAIGDITIKSTFVASHKVFILETPATADAADTIDVSTLFDEGCHSVVSSSATLAPTLAADLFAAKSVTLPAGATNEVHTIVCTGL